MTHISFPEPPGKPAVPDPFGAPEPDESAPDTSNGVPLRDRLIGVGVVLVLVAILGGTVVWRVNRDEPERLTAFIDPSDQPGGSGSSSSTAPPSTEEWPADILPLVRFVERSRGAPFDRPVPIEFLSEADYQASVQEETTDTTPEDTTDLENWEGQMRALGLLDATTDLQDALDQAYSEGTLAYYDSEDDRIRVRGTEVDVAGRVTLVHELVHAWQDQQGFLDGYEEMEDSEAFILQTLVEGDATRIEDEYVASLSSSELDDYQDQSAEQAGDVDLDGIPSFMLAGFFSPYAIGGPLTTIIAEDGGNPSVDEALADPPPGESDLMSVERFYDQTVPLEVAEPSVPDGAERLDGGPFGAWSWHILLSEKVDPRVALDVADTWGGDNSVLYRQGGRVCTAAAYRGLTPADTVAAGGVIDSWAAQMPGHDATVERLGEDIVMRTCESSAGADVVGRSEVAVQFPVVRLQATLEALTYGGSLEEAICFGDHIVDAISYEDMASGATFDTQTMNELGDAATSACVD